MGMTEQKRKISAVTVGFSICGASIVLFTGSLIAYVMADNEIRSLQDSTYYAGTPYLDRLQDHSELMETLALIGLGGIVFSVSILFLIALERAWSESQARREEAARVSGVRLRAGLEKVKMMGEKAVDSAGRKPLARSGVSLADELRKWDQLRQDGLITQDEFDKIRKDLVGS